MRAVPRRVAAVAVAGVVAAGGYLTLDVYDVVPGVLTLEPPTQAAPPSASPANVAGPAVAQPRDAPGGMPLAASGAGQPAPTPEGLQVATAGAIASPALRGALGLTVRDVATASHLLDLRADEPMLPASSLKLLSAAAVDATFPPGAVLTTKVVQGSSPDRVVLVAGGDTLLNPGAGDPRAVAGRAGLGDLAAATASALRSTGVGRVSVSLDLSYAPGPLLAPTWTQAFRPAGLTGAVATIGLASERAVPGRPGPQDPAASAWYAFVAALSAHGIAASPADRAAAPAGAATIASVTSAPVVDQLALALDESDNALTESLTRQAAYRTGTAPGFAETAAFVRSTLAALGVDVTGVTSVDASGLSRENRLPVRVLGDLLVRGASGSLPGMGATLRALPVAGLTGTLAGRFVDPDTHTAAGVTRAKTGTLTGANALAGTVVTAEGRLLAFAAVANGSGPAAGTPLARAALDRFVAVLATCGCRG